ncbi:MAG: prepilin-type N-terminal cleavage/methylation domain-containing protein [Gemmatales bacterium]|nr:MAG: prepilin-type N-terminal cleavage/methylation domain-containing protein [Gemmatales bacterium]
MLSGRKRYRCQAAFTLIELLVVIAIIGVLVALLLPAVQKVREAANRMKCGNHLKQIGVALHTYHDAHGFFPPGGITEGFCCGTRSKENWAILILPYIEQKNIYDRYNFNAFNEDPTNDWVRRQPVPIYNCPADIQLNQTLRPESGPGSGLQYMVGSYRAVSGKSLNGWRSFDNAEALNMDQGWRGALHTVWEARGLFPERLTDVSNGDGTSHTLMVGEMTTKTHLSRRTFWAYTYTSYNQSSTIPQSRSLLGDYDQCVAIGGEGGSNPCKRGWGSFHPGGIQFVRCDGSVQLIARSIDMNLFSNLGSIAGNDPIPNWP